MFKDMLKDIVEKTDGAMAGLLMDSSGIVMGTRGMGSTEALLGSIARQVVQLSDVPVTLVK